MCRRFKCQQNGPNVNVKSLKVLQKQGEENSLRQLIDIGTQYIWGFPSRSYCNKYRIKIHFERCFLFTPFTYSPARHDDFTSITGGTVFPLYFCEMRWIEDKRVAERLLES